MTEYVRIDNPHETFADCIDVHRHGTIYCSVLSTLQQNETTIAFALRFPSRFSLIQPLLRMDPSRFAYYTHAPLSLRTRRSVFRRPETKFDQIYCFSLEYIFRKQSCTAVFALTTHAHACSVYRKRRRPTPGHRIPPADPYTRTSTRSLKCTVHIFAAHDAPPCSEPRTEKCSVRT